MRTLPLILAATALAAPCLGFFAACGGSTHDNGGDASTDAKPDRVVHADTGAGDDGGEAGVSPPCSMVGTADLAVKLYTFFPALPVPGASVRAENATDQCAEAITGADGIAHVMVDLSKGPFDVTVAGANLSAGDAGTPFTMTTLSVLGVTTAPLNGTLTASPQTSAASPNQAKIAGNIIVPAAILDGGATSDAGATGDAGYRVFIDGWDFQTVVQAAQLPSFSTEYQYDPTMLPGLPLPLSGMLVDSNDQIIAGLYSAATPRTGLPMGVNLDFTGATLTPTTTSITIQWPTTGVVTPSALTTIGTPAGMNAVIGNAIVVKTTTMESSAEQFVGIGNITIPDASGQSTLTLQTLPPPADPSIADAVLFGSQFVAEVVPHTLTAGAIETVGAVTAMNTVSGPNGDLSDVTFTAAGTGYDSTTMVIWNGSATAGVDYWILYGPASVTNHGLPHLPTTVQSSDVIGAAAIAYVGLAKYRSGAPSPWAATAPDVELSVYQNPSAGVPLSTTGR